MDSSRNSSPSNSLAHPAVKPVCSRPLDFPPACTGLLLPPYTHTQTPDAAHYLGAFRSTPGPPSRLKSDTLSQRWKTKCKIKDTLTILTTRKHRTKALNV